MCVYECVCVCVCVCVYIVIHTYIHNKREEVYKGKRKGENINE